MSDISVEPLWNAGSVDGKPGVVPIDTVGICATRAAVTATATRQQITMTSGYRTIELQNVGSNILYYGGSTVTDSNGIRLYPNSTKIFANVKSTFSLYLVCAAGQTTETRINEFT